MRWIEWIWKRQPLTPLEQGVLAEVCRLLAPEASQLLEGQLLTINLVQRHAGGREVCLYPMRRGRPQHNDQLRLPAAQEELKLATVLLEDQEGLFTAEVHLVRGYVFSIEFTSTISKARARARNLVIRRTELHLDPMQASATPGDSEPATGDEKPLASSWLSAPAFSSLVCELRPPMPEPDRSQCIGDIDAFLPPSYLEATRVSDGFRVGRTRVLGLREVYSVMLEEGGYYVLAQVDDEGFLAVRTYSRDGAMVLLPFDGPPRAAGLPFHEVILAVERGQVTLD